MVVVVQLQLLDRVNVMMIKSSVIIETIATIAILLSSSTIAAAFASGVD